MNTFDTLSPPERQKDDDLTAVLRDLRAAEERLQAALCGHRPESILQAVEEQERLADRLRDVLDPRAASAFPSHPAQPQTVAELARDIRRLARFNHQVATALADVVERTLSRLAGTPRDAQVYGAAGNLVGPRAAPVLVRQEG